MYKVLLVGSIEYNTRMLAGMGVWGNISGFEVGKCVHDGAAALGCLRKEHFDMVITEINVSGVDGMQILRHVNQENLCPVVVILSDTVEFQYVRECILFGAFDYLKKMPDAQTILDVLGRAREQLVSREGAIVETVDLQYPQMEEEKIFQAFFKEGEESVSLFSDALEKIYNVTKEQSVQNDLTAKNLYRKIISRVFESCMWLHHYVNIDYYKQLDYLWAGSQNGFQDFFVRKMNHLHELYHRLFLQASDKSLNALVEYILDNPEADLRLKTVAENAFLNYSYLSSNFAAKTGLHYNDYITMVKMARAAYLLQNTDLKIYEICSMVSYQDTNYFTRQFRKIYDLSPSEYKMAAVGDESLDSACL